MKIREIHIRKTLGGYHANATTDGSSADAPAPKKGDEDKPSLQADDPKLTAYSDDLMTAIKSLKTRMRKARVDWRRARIVSNIGPTGVAKVKSMLGESLITPKATMKDFLELFD